MKRVLMLLTAIAFATGACERHEFEGPDGTKRLSERHEQAAPAKEIKDKGQAAEGGPSEKADH